MTAMIRRLVLLAMLLAAPAAAWASPVGLWRTVSDVDGKPRGLVRIEAASDGTLRGVAAGSLVPGEDPGALCLKCQGARRNKPLLGMEILWGLKPDPKEPGAYVGGSVLDPDSGNVYRARVKLAPDGRSLTLRGYLGTPALGRSQTWTRAPAP